ncbi:hypothetical protein [Tepidibacter mesophilus]|uniref:hypothetical protein n=1 Tax=Tepidibacter mesophilus TaxID=655607 RepID=UPI000C069629|nr:hypothetical protein [Tepidibacter mesophilus]
MNKILLFIIYLFPIVIILTYKNKNKYMFTLMYVLTLLSIFVMNRDMDESIQAIKYENNKIRNMISINNTNKKIDYEKNKEQKIVFKQKVDNQINSNEENLQEEVLDDNSHLQVINSNKTYGKNLNKDQVDVKNSLNNVDEDNKKETDEIKMFNDFKKEIQDIEKQGLVPLRNCYGVLKKLQKGKANMDELLEEAQNSRQKCEQVELMYKELEVPEFKDEENTKLLEDAKLDIQKAFYIRKKAMDYGIEFLDNKNPKYIIKIKDSLKLSDKLVHSCIDKMNKVKSNIKK